jgi:hypothetical protein
MRTNTLRRLANNQLSNDHRGTHRDKQHRHFVIHKVIHDLFVLNIPPAQWHGLHQSHILTLVAHWKKRGIKSTTIMKYMTVLRYFLQQINHTIESIDNASLGLSKPIYKTNHVATIPTITHPIVSTLFQLQTEFGLTFSEAIRLTPDIHLKTDALWITRDIAFNSKDRMIPIRNQRQIQTLKSLNACISSMQNLMSAIGYHAICHLYRTEMHKFGVSSKQSYRYLYAKSLSSYLGKETIMFEMGIQSPITLRNYLHE